MGVQNGNTILVKNKQHHLCVTFRQVHVYHEMFINWHTMTWDTF